MHYSMLGNPSGDVGDHAGIDMTCSAVFGRRTWTGAGDRQVVEGWIVLEAHSRIVPKSSLPSLPIRGGDLHVASALEQQHRLFQRLGFGNRIDLVDAAPIGSRQV